MQAQELASLISSESFNAIVEERTSLSCRYCKDQGPEKLECGYAYDKPRNPSASEGGLDGGIRIAVEMDLLEGGRLIMAHTSWRLGVQNCEPQRKSEFIAKGLGWFHGATTWRIEEHPGRAGADTFFVVVENEWGCLAPDCVSISGAGTTWDEMFAETLSDRLRAIIRSAKEDMPRSLQSYGISPDSWFSGMEGPDWADNALTSAAPATASPENEDEPLFGSNDWTASEQPPAPGANFINGFARYPDLKSSFIQSIQPMLKGNIKIVDFRSDSSAWSSRWCFKTEDGRDYELECEESNYERIHASIRLNAYVDIPRGTDESAVETMVASILTSDIDCSVCYQNIGGLLDEEDKYRIAISSGICPYLPMLGDSAFDDEGNLVSSNGEYPEGLIGCSRVFSADVGYALQNIEHTLYDVVLPAVAAQGSNL